MWKSYSLDPRSGELFIPVGNPALDFEPGNRPGTNLFSDSLLVLDTNSGKLRCWHQLVPPDSHDYDLGAAPALYVDVHGAPRVVAPGKDGYVHVVDRSSHRLVLAPLAGL